MSLSIYPSPDLLTPEQQKDGRFRIITFSLVVMIITSAISPQILSLLALKLDPDAGNSILSIFFIAPFLSLFTVFMGPLVDRVGKKRVMVPFYIASIFFPPLMALACSLTGWFSPMAIIWILVALVMVRRLMQVLGLASWFPLMSDNLPAEIRGRFLGIMRTCWQIEVFILTAVIGWFFGDNPEIWHFQALFLVSFFFSIIRVIILLGIPEAPLVQPPEKKPFFAEILKPLRNRSYRNFLIFCALFSFGNSFQGVFALRLMKDELGAGAGLIVFLSGFTSLGAVFSLYLLGKVVDRFGSKIVYSLMLPPMACLNLVWIFIDSSSPWWPWFIGGYYFTFGACLFGCGVAQTTMIFASAPKRYRAAYMSLPVMINNVMFGVAPFCAALISDQILVHWEGDILAWGLSVNRMIFILRMCLALIPLFFIHKLSRRHGGRVREALGEVSSYATTQLQNFYRRW